MSEVESTDEEFEVEDILDTRKKKTKGAVREYVIKWKGYPNEEDNSWEPESNLDCQEILEKFKKEVMKSYKNVDLIFCHKKLPRLAKGTKENSNKKKRKRRLSDEKKTISNASDTELGGDSITVRSKVSFWS